MAGGAAIDGDEQRRAAAGERPHRLDVRAVAFEQPVGDVDQRIEPGVAQEARQRRRRGRAIDVVVAEDRDASRRACTASAMRAAASSMPASDVRIGHQRPHGRIEKARHVVDRDAAPGEDARQQFRHVVVALRDGERLRGAALVEPVAPGAPARRMLDAEKQAPGRSVRKLSRHVHGP